MKDSEAHELLEEHPRAIAHLRSQFESKRFGLVLGSGISSDFHVPLWADLVKAIAAEPDVDGEALLAGAASKKALPFQTEMLFERFRQKRMPASHTQTVAEENATAAAWLQLCQRCIYSGAVSDLEKALKEHPYLEHLIPLVQGSYLTINFNFDDFLERSLALRKVPRDKGNRGFEAVTDPWPQFRRTDSVIYHPHGYVPAGIMESPVDRFVFSEAGYSKQYVGARGHDTSFLTAHFARNTCLLVGCSLEDELRNVLMRGAHFNPGNYHYFIHYVKDASSLGAEERKLIEDTNFKIYNLITLFLNGAQIAVLLQLINHAAVPDDDLRDAASVCSAQLRYTFYMTGALGVGKSTTSNLLRSLSVLDEWLEPRLEVLGKPWDELTNDEKQAADSWIIDQFKKKNDSLRRQKKPDIRVVDRPPVDPLVFTPENERATKATSLLKGICVSKDHQIESGVVILLLGNPKELSARVCATGRSDYTEEKLARMQNDMLAIYKGQPGVVVIDTNFLTIPDVTKRVAQVIHRDPYIPADLMNLVKSHQGKSSAVSRP